ncbi:MAG: hypothetical protein M3312_05710 [Actinomycetota bacterium]|nr:hypothetical protein [Actinomycetota bacterium]
MSGVLFKTFRAETLDRDYWLGRCEGYRVESSRRRLGTIEALRFESRADRPDALVVRGGIFRRRTILVPVSDVLDILPHEHRIVVRDEEAGERVESSAER